MNRAPQPTGTNMGWPQGKRRVRRRDKITRLMYKSELIIVDGTLTELGN